MCIKFYLKLPTQVTVLPRIQLHVIYVEALYF